MNEQAQKALAVVISEALLLVTAYDKLIEFGWLSAKTFLLAGIAALGSLLFKSAFTWLGNKIKKAFKL